MSHEQAPTSGGSTPPPAPDPDSDASIGRLAGNTSVQVAGNVAASAIGFLTFVVVTRGLGSDGFGTLTTALVFLIIPVVLADVGLSTSVLREISAAPARTEAAMRAALPLRTMISFVAIVLAVGVAYALPLDADTKDAIGIGAPGAFFSLMSLSVLPVLQARLMMHWVIAGTVVGRVVTLAATVAVLEADYGLPAVMLANVVGLAVTFAVHLAVVGRIVPLRPVVDVAYWRSLAVGSLAIGLALAIAQIYFRIDALLIAGLRDPHEVGLYGAAFKFIELSDLVGAAIGISVFPLLARFVATDPERSRSLLQRTFDVLLAAAAPIALLFALRATDIILLTSGPEFRDAAGALRLLAPYVLLTFVSGLLWRALIAWDEDRRLLAIALVLLTFNVGVNLVLIPVYGFRAAAVVSVFSEILAVVLMGMLAIRRHALRLSFRYVLPVLAAAAAMAAILALPSLHLLVAAPLGLLAYLAVLIAMRGAVRDIVTQGFLPAARRAASR
jgi:O-antigen/teichoic acid export membrane protein